jgi:ATP-dependent helicase/nuclease subunit B
MAACPFKHFVRFGLGLSSRRKAEVGGAELGQVYHRMLERLVSNAITASRDDDAPPLNITPAQIHDAAIEVARALRGELMLGSARNRYLLARIERNLADWLESQRAMLRRGSFRPARTSVAFGEQGPLPPVRIKIARGGEIRVSGNIDRVDIRPESGEAIAIDYRLTGHSLSLSHVYHGLSLQLVIYLLALEAGGKSLAEAALSPAGGFYVSLLRSIVDVDHPDEAADPSSEAYLLKIKPRGIFDAGALEHLDGKCTDGWSDVVAAYRKKEGGFGYLKASDCATTEELRGLMRRVEQRIGEVAGHIEAGRIDITPYRLVRESPCASCDYRGICRFERPANRYAILTPMSREQALEAVRGGGSHAG